MPIANGPLPIGVRAKANTEEYAINNGQSAIGNAAMIIGILQVELIIDDPQSLKDKRRVVQSMKDRLHREHQVSVAEVGSLDDRHRAVLGITMASNSVPHCQSTLDRILQKVRCHRDCALADHTTEILTGK